MAKMDAMVQRPVAPDETSDRPTYEIVVRVRVQGMLLQALDGFDVVPGGTRTTCFRGEVEDQADLQRVLHRILACNLHLASVRRIDGEAPPVGAP
jgi:hypothetical protein